MSAIAHALEQMQSAQARQIARAIRSKKKIPTTLYHHHAEAIKAGKKRTPEERAQHNRERYRLWRQRWYATPEGKAMQLANNRRYRLKKAKKQKANFNRSTTQGEAPRRQPYKF